MSANATAVSRRAPPSSAEEPPDGDKAASIWGNQPVKFRWVDSETAYTKRKAF